ncbi:MAG TPA: hypothetical protein PLS05_05920 [Clostridia bacterium]|jgi:hypothetical protein|nr:hypothetical protein [Clostridia bacterium]
MDIESAVKKLNEGIDEFYRSRLILVDRVIAAFLQTLAGDSVLMATLQECASSVNYANEYKKAISKDGIGSYFLLPQGSKQIITLVTGLLYEFDNKTLSIVDFVTKFFPAETSHESYVSFCDRVIRPYGEAFSRMLKGEPDAVTETLAEAAPQPLTFPDKAKEDCEFWLKALLDVVTGDNSAPEDKRREYFTMIKGMMYVLDGRNPLLIKLLWIGLKNTLSGYKPSKRELDEIKLVLFTYGVLD